MSEPTKAEMDIHYAIGFLLEWVKDAPAQVKDNLDQVISGVDYYSQKLKFSEEDYQTLNKRYNDLTALTAGYLAMIQQQKEQIDQLLIDSQRDFHRKEE